MKIFQLKTSSFYSQFNFFSSSSFNSFCRGFGFITFADPGSVDKVLNHGTHELDGKKVSLHKIFEIKFLRDVILYILDEGEHFFF